MLLVLVGVFLRAESKGAYSLHKCFATLLLQFIWILLLENKYRHGIHWENFWGRDHHFWKVVLVSRYGIDS